MTASRNTFLALGLMLLTLTAGKPAMGAPTATCGGSSCEASCGTSGVSASPAPSTSGCNCGGEAKYNAGCKADCGFCETDDFARDYPTFDACAPYFRDFCEICESCTWKAEASALIVTRSSPGTRTTLTDPTTAADLFDASRFQFPFAAGPRVSLTALDCEGWGVEVNYFGIDGWSATADIPNSSLPSGFGLLAVDSVTQLPLTNAHFESTAALYSAEVNFRRPLFGNFSALAGFRWLELRDKYLASGTSALTGNLASESILTHNHLYGFQIGADGALAKDAERWRITGFVKAGIFLNDADQATSLSDPGGLGALAVNNNLNVASFFGETGIIGYFQITKHLAASGGYQVMFVNNVAQPANQIAGTNLTSSTASIDATSGLFYHGASVGLELTW